ncbi:MAG: Sec-independent protein translocase protein TatB [Sulfuricaulis sp.]
MFDIGFSELVVIGLIALIVLGPKRLPEVARTAGRWMGQLRRFISEVKSDLDREIHNENLTELRKLKQELSDTRQLMHNTSGDLIQGFTEVTPASSTPTIHSDGLSAPAPVPAAKSRRAPAAKKSRSGKKHGTARKPRRR